MSMGGGGNKPKRAKQSAQEAQLARMGVSDWNEFVNDYVPVMHQTAELSRVSDGDRRDLAESASAATAQQQPHLRSIARDSTGGMAGGQAVSRVSQMANAAPGTTASQINRGVRELRGRELEGLSQAMLAGRGVKSTGLSGLSSRGSSETGAAINKQQRQLEQHQGRTSAIMGLAGTASRMAYDKWGPVSEGGGQ